MKKFNFFFAFVFLCSSFSYADHLSGANITYRCVSGNTYEITLEFYRDCGGAVGVGGCDLNFSPTCAVVNGGSTCWGVGTFPTYFYYYSSSNGYCAQDSFLMASAVVTPVSPVCPSMISTCSGGTVPGVEKYTMKKNITLPYQAADWTFMYANTFRNVAINTISHSIPPGMAVRSTLNNVAAPCNSSPSFGAPNVTYLCTGRPFCYNQGMTESDGDSIVYSLVVPRSILLASFVTYLSGYSYTNPFGNASPIIFNSTTGSVCVTPAATMVTIMAMRVSEYRNGVLIGSVERDMSFIVSGCNNDFPVVSGINGLPYLNNNATNVCAGSALCFNVTGSDPNSIDTLTMSWDNAISSATFNVTGNNTISPSGQFCWTPSLSDVRNAPYPFTVKINDNGCPYQGTQYFPFNISVKACAGMPKAIFYSSDTSFCDESGECIDFYDISTGSPTSWKWSFPGAVPDTSTTQNPTAICYYSPGTYAVKLVVTNSGGSDSSLVSPLIIFGGGAVLPVLTTSHDTVFCSHEASYQWYCNGLPVAGATDSFFVAMSCATCQSISVYITDDVGCSRLSNPVVCSGINDLIGNSGISIYPNPAGNELWVSASGLWAGREGLTVELCNVLGEIVYRNRLVMRGAQTFSIDVSAFAKGVYSLRLMSEEKMHVGRIIKE